MKPPTDRPQTAAPTCWENRLFHNTFTRGGGRRRSDKWSVKLQFQGRRRTFSLPSAARAEAAAEARSLAAILRTAGWDAAVSAHAAIKNADLAVPVADRLGDWAADNPAYWKARLIRRKYPDRLESTPGELSARIEHGETYRFFPLGSSDPETASLVALEIRRELHAKGWQSVLARWRTEFTLAVFWRHSPVACTYTTLHSLGDGVLAPPGLTKPKAGVRIGLIEPDAAIAPVLRRWVGRQPGVRSVASFVTAAATLNALGHQSIDLLFVNRALPDLPAATLLLKLRSIHPKLPAFLYAICEDSDQIFVSLTGVPSGYFLQRRQPDNLFAPIRSALLPKAFSPRMIALRVRDYFQAYFDTEAQSEDHAWLDQLTAREQEILNCVGKGYPDKEISHILGISVWTVHNHLKRIYEKLNVRTRTEAVVKSLQK